MRVRVLKEFITANRAFHVGEVAEIDPRKAAGWLAAGLVMQDKSLDGASETKAKPTPKTKRKRRKT